jgi:predicted DNA-binding transcriptional regulator YafY
MKIDRLIGILSLLLQQERVTAPYLAEKFEVSRRTINRDIEDLCKAGIPIVTMQGINGGIAIMDGYKMERTLLTSSDMQAILTGLRSLDSICGTKRYQQLMNKLSVEESSILASNSHIRIDLASWYKTQLAPKIACIQDAIEQHQMITFTYYAPNGESERTVEPYLLMFQWASWYVWGYCTMRQDFRMFKLNRMQELHMTSETFKLREHPDFELDHREIFPQNFEAEAVFLPEMKWRLVEEYGIESFTEQENGTLLFRAGFMDKASLFGWLLTFGDKVELRKPLVCRNELAAILERTLNQYRNM